MKLFLDILAIVVTVVFYICSFAVMIVIIPQELWMIIGGVIVVLAFVVVPVLWAIDRVAQIIENLP